jgi:hypothetical protein
LVHGDFDHLYIGIRDPCATMFNQPKMGNGLNNEHDATLATKTRLRHGDVLVFQSKRASNLN